MRENSCRGLYGERERFMVWVEIILDLILTVFCYLLVPVIFCIRHKPMTKKQINRVIWINGAILWLLFRIISIAINGEPGTGASVFLWSWVGKKIMERVLLKDEENAHSPKMTTDNAENKEIEENPQMSLSLDNEKPKKYGNWHIYGNDIRLNNQNENSQVLESQASPLSKDKICFCRKCGNKLLEDSQFCNKCGTKVISEEQ